MVQMKLVSPNRIEKDESDIPTPEGDQVLIEVKAASICGSDIELFEGKTDVKFPVVLGHDFSGLVKSVGDKVMGIRPGDRVAVDPQRSCGQCDFCRRGLARFCEEYSYMGKGFDGAFQEYVLVEDRYCVPLPESVSYEEAAMLEPLAVALHTFEFLSTFVGDTVVIFGCGPIGIAHIQLGKAMGLKVVALEPLDGRREAAKRFGADVVLDPSTDELADRLREEISGRNFFVEAAGAPESLALCIKHINRGGMLAMVGSCNLKQNLREFLLKGLTFYGVRGGGGMYPRAVSLISRRVVDVASMISKRFSLTEIGDAIRYNIANKADVIKIIVKY